MAKVESNKKSKSVKKSAVKKPVVKKLTAKKPAAKKPTAKKPVAKKPTAKKSEAGKPVSKKPAAKPITVRVPPRIVSKAKVVRPPETVSAETSGQAVAFAASIAEAMKLCAAKEAKQRDEGEIRLSQRPTSRQQGKNSVKFPAPDLKNFRQRLIEARERSLAGVDSMKATGFNESDDHEADGGDGTNQTLRLQALGQVGQINRTIQQIDEALHRIDDGTYGVCTVCGQLIRKQRLLNQPFVLTCMECQNDMEKSRL